MKRRAWLFGVFLAALIAGVTLVGRINRPAPPLPLPPIDEPIAALPATHPLARRYRLEAQVAQSGWTPALHEQAGDLYYETGEHDRAAWHWRLAVTTQPTRLRHLAEIDLARQDWPLAVDSLGALLAQDPDDLFAHYHLGLIYAPLYPDWALDHLMRSARSMTYAEVANALVPLIRDNRADPQLSFRVGLLLLRYEVPVYAEHAFFQSFIAAYPAPTAAAYVGLTRAQQGKDGAAWMEFALQTAPQMAEVQFVHGLYLRQRLDLSASQQAITTAVMLDPDNPAYLLELGYSYQQLQQYDDAEYWLERAVIAADRSPAFQSRLAQFYATDGYLLSASRLTTIRDARDYLPPDPAIIASYAWTLYQLGEERNALRELDDLLATFPDHSAGLYYKARILLDAGQPDSARPLLERLQISGDVVYVAWAGDQLALLDAG